MPDPSTPVFVRRGAKVQGPVPFAKVAALLKAGTLQPTDEVATSANGPWIPLRAASPAAAPGIPVVDTLTIKRTVFGGYVAHYPCPKCTDPLQSSESEMSQVETCPTCGVRYRLSSRAAAQVVQAKNELERQRAEQAAAAAREREHRAAERQAAAARREEERRRQADERRAEEERRVTAERHVQQRAAAVRRRGGACWYCGSAQLPALPQCYACRMPARAGRN